ncbi:MAG: sterol desaturase family protein [Pseudomonadota bacterium]
MAPEDTPVTAGHGKSREWHYNPDLPIGLTPLFDWPPKPLAALRWLSRYWLALSMTLIELALATMVYVWLQPPVEVMQTLSAGWILQIWARNVALVVLVAGSLHLWLYHFRKQDRELKFDHREQATDNGAFTFRSQLLDNMFWSLASGVTIWTAWEVIYFWAASNGWAPGASLAGNPVWFVAWFALIPIWSSFHFYWVHRFLHLPTVYKAAHALHHRNINVGPWSGISMHPIEHALFYTNFLIHFVVPSHPVHFLFHAYFQSIGPIASHSGFGFRGADREARAAHEAG